MEKDINKRLSKLEEYVSEELESIRKEAKTSKPKDIKITDINNIEDLYKRLGKERKNEIPFSKPKTSFEKYCNASMDMKTIAEAYNEGTKLDWKNSSIYKYLPYKYCSCGAWLVGSHYWSASGGDCSLGFYFKSRELSDKAVSNFRSIYEDFWNFE